MPNCLLRNFDRISLSHLEDGRTSLFTDNPELFDCRRTVYVAGDKQRTVTVLYKIFCKLCGVCRLTSALQAAHHDDGRRLGRKINAFILAAHQRAKLVVYNFNNLLCGRQAFHNLGADGAFTYRFDKIPHNLIADVRLKQSHFDLAHGLLDIGLSQLALLPELFKRPGKLVGKRFKCQSSSLLFRHCRPDIFE